jgi:hypothetical protein
MKNVFFALAFMLVGTFAFANTEVTPDIDIDKIESLISVDNLEIPADYVEDFYCGFEISFDTAEGSGSFWYDCSGDTSANSNLLADFLVCMFWDCDWSNGW